MKTTVKVGLDQASAALLQRYLDELQAARTMWGNPPADPSAAPFAYSRDIESKFGTGDQKSDVPGNFLQGPPDPEGTAKVIEQVGPDTPGTEIPGTLESFDVKGGADDLAGALIHIRQLVVEWQKDGGATLPEAIELSAKIVSAVNGALSGEHFAYHETVQRLEAESRRAETKYNLACRDRDAAAHQMQLAQAREMRLRRELLAIRNRAVRAVDIFRGEVD